MKKILKGILDLGVISVPRYLRLNFPPGGSTLVTFSDGGLMGATPRSFLVSSPLPDGIHEVHMMGNSQKILREEQGSAPKAEVTGLLMASRAQVHSHKNLSDLNITRFIIAADSEVALNLTAGFSNALLSWFAPRITEIQTNLRMVQARLYFIPGNRNPGDISTKNIPLDILKCPEYWKTSFLQLPENK